MDSGLALSARPGMTTQKSVLAARFLAPEFCSATTPYIPRHHRQKARSAVFPANDPVVHAEQWL
jgi:hypothetical protein